MLEYDQLIVILPKRFVGRIQLDRISKVFLGQIEVGQLFVGLKHAVVGLHIALVERESLFGKLDALVQHGLLSLLVKADFDSCLLEGTESHVGVELGQIQ